MFDIKSHSLNNWEIKINNRHYFSGSFLKAMYLCVTRLGFHPSDLEEGVKFLCQNDDHDSIHFGINKSFMWTYNSEDKYERKTG